MNRYDDFDTPHISNHSLNIIKILNLPFVKNFYCYFLTGVNMVALLYLSKGSLAERFVDPIVSYHLSSIWNIVLDWHNQLCVST